MAKPEEEDIEGTVGPHCKQSQVPFRKSFRPLQSTKLLETSEALFSRGGEDYTGSGVVTRNSSVRDTTNIFMRFAGHGKLMSVQSKKGDPVRDGILIQHPCMKLKIVASCTSILDALSGGADSECSWPLVLKPQQSFGTFGAASVMHEHEHCNCLACKQINLPVTRTFASARPQDASKTRPLSDFGGAIHDAFAGLIVSIGFTGLQGL